MFPYKFAPPSGSQKDIHQTSASFNNPLKRSGVDVTQSASVDTNLNTSRRRGFDSNFSQSFAPRHVEPRVQARPAYTPETIDTKFSVSSTGASRLLDNPTGETTFNSRAFIPGPSGEDYPKVSIKAETPEIDLKLPMGEVGLILAGKLHESEKREAEQREYIADLESRLATKQEQYAMLSKNFVRIENALKQTAEKNRDALGRALKNYTALKSELDDLKRASESSSLIIAEAKATMESLAVLRDSTQINLHDLQSMIDDDGRFISTAEMRSVVHELRSELSKTQQVADLLREKLHSMGSDLAEARARISQMEESIREERNRSDSALLQMRQSADKIGELTRYLGEQKHDTVETTVKFHAMEQELLCTQRELQEAKSVITSMREDTNAREELREELQAKLRTLRHTIDFQEGNVKAFETRARTAEEELVQALNHNHELQGRIDSALALEKNLTQQASRLLSERDEIKEKVLSVERLLAEVQSCEKKLFSDLTKTLNERDALSDKLKSFDDVNRELKVCRERYAESQVSLKVLQERADDQCLTLAASKESVGELQERIRAATETSIESKREIFYLKEQNAMWKTKFDSAEQEIEDKSTSFRRELEEKNAAFHALRVEVSRKEGIFEGLLEAERLSKKEALNRVQEANTKVDSLLAELARKDHGIEELTKRLSATEAPSAEREQEVSTLKTRVVELEATEKRLVDRATSISRRYENNDLNDDEKELVALLMQKARGIHDREMVEKTNEIKRRDTMLKQNEARITQLENALARKMCEKSSSASAKGIDEESSSMAIDIANLKPQPEASSSDHRPEIRGMKHEGPSATATHRTADGASVNPSIAGPSSRSTGYSTFSKLCKEDTDDIANFEDVSPVATGKRAIFTGNDIEDGSSRPARRVKFARGTSVEKPVLDQGVVPATSSTSNKKKAARRR